ncbi:MAG: hypothetical protein JWN66_4871 [Sphingomonas bacterium]|uniref:hypothetical protein n=1 Tax=Sphingomonas bacterium TaxID=1895847 RepID=UPI0026167929|nr:hypothetical protein [Sphingomonas bacterium]MDB5707755.1 hypothetical protein [Sphingomonas bacterium]
MPIVAILALATVAAAPGPKQATTAAKPVCQNTNRYDADQQQAPPGAHKLSAEPPAAQILTVLRTVDGCTQPVVIREDVGAPRR